MERDTRIDFLPRADALAPDLWERCLPEPLEGAFWYRALEASGLEDQFLFRYGVIRRGGREVGIAPCFVHDVPISLVAPAPVAWVLRQLSRFHRRAGYQRTFFVGSPCADEGTVGLAPGVELAAVAPALRAAALAQARALGASLAVFKDFPSAEAAVLAGPDPAGTFASTLSYPGTVLALPAGGKEAYYRSLSHNRRHHLLKKLRRSREFLPLETRVTAEPTDAEIGEICGLFRQTYERGRTKFERLDRPFFLQMRGAPPARFLLQRDPVSGRLAAFMLLFQLGPRVINKFIGLDYGRGPEAFLYFRLFDAALDFAYACGARELQSGQTGYRAKLDLGHRLVPLHNVFRHRSPPVHALFRAIGRSVTWASLDSSLGRQVAPP